MSRQLKRLFCFFLYVLGITPFLFRRIFKCGNPALVLLYHHICKPGSPFEPAVPPAEFEKQMRFMQKHFELISASELVGRIEKGISVDRPQAVISFDDGYRDNLEAAYPILSRYKIPAIIFLATASIGTGEPIWTSRVDQLFRNAVAPRLRLDNLQGGKSFELGDTSQRMKVSYLVKKEMKDVPDSRRHVVLKELEEKIGIPGAAEEETEMLSWAEVGRLLEDPLIEIGSHTVTHRMLDHLPAEEIREELLESKAKIEAETGRKIDFLSYPGNGYNSKVLDAAREAGYRAAFAVDHGLTCFSQDRFALKRLHVQDEPIDVLLAEITMVLPAIRDWAARLKLKRNL
ncbi:MAG TPA: polysaccharide deacetylase family protein [bacterium]|nr:polysaccharide deacetylase family protein [bacterium]